MALGLRVRAGPLPGRDMLSQTCRTIIRRLLQHGRTATFEVRVHADQDRQEIVAAPSSRSLEGSGWTGVFQDQPEPGRHRLDRSYGVGQAVPDAVVVAPGAQGWSPVIGAVAVGAAALPAPDVVVPMEPDAPELSLEAG